MRRAAELQRKRERKAAKRRAVLAKKKFFHATYGAFVGERMYQEWRGRSAPKPKVAEKPKQPIPEPAAKSKRGFLGRIFGATG